MSFPTENTPHVANGALQEAAVANQASGQVPVPGALGEDQDSVALNATTLITSSTMTIAEQAAASAVASSVAPPPPVTTRNIGPISSG